MRLEPIVVDYIRMTYYYVAYSAIFIYYYYRSNKDLHYDTLMTNDATRYILSFLTVNIVFFIGMLISRVITISNVHISSAAFYFRNIFSELFTVYFETFLQITFYFAILLILLPYIRKHFIARTCAFLWLLPIGVLVTSALHILPRKPLFVIPFGLFSIYWFVAVWAVGFIGIMAYKIIGHIKFRNKLMKNARTVTDERIIELWKKMQRYWDVDETYYFIMVSPDAKTPITIGPFRAPIRLILPDVEYTKDELELIFSHELIHIKKYDSGVKLLLNIFAAMCWFNPLMWLAIRRCSEDLELRCDEMVVRGQNKDTKMQYANLILDTAGDEQGFTTCLSASAKAMRYRLKQIVHPKKRFIGGIMAGAILFLLINTNGFIALAYQNGTGG